MNQLCVATCSNPSDPAAARCKNGLDRFCLWVPCRLERQYAAALHCSFHPDCKLYQKPSANQLPSRTLDTSCRGEHAQSGSPQDASEFNAGRLAGFQSERKVGLLAK